MLREDSEDQHISFLLRWEWLRMWSLLSLMFSFLAFLSWSMRSFWLYFILMQYLLKVYVFSLSSFQFSIIFLFIIRVCTYIFFRSAIFSLFSSFSLLICSYIFTSASLLFQDSLALSSSICLIRESSLKDMSSFKSLVSFILQSSSICFSNTVLSYFNDFIYLFNPLSIFFCCFISLLLLTDSYCNIFICYLSLVNQAWYSFSFLMFNFISYYYFHINYLFSLITSSYKNINYALFSYNYDFNSATVSFPCVLLLNTIESLYCRDFRLVLSVALSELMGVKQGLFLGVWFILIKKSSVFIQLLNSFPSFYAYFDVDLFV